MKIGVISDTHIPEKASKIPKEILDAFKDMDMVIHCGDLIELSVLDELKKVCKDVRAVKGNMDRHGAKEQLPEKEIIKTGDYTIAVTHGFGAPDKLIDYLKGFFKNEKVDMIVFGHSHSPLNEKIGKILFFNPGSATDKIFSSYNSYGIIEADESGIKAKIVRI